MRLAALTSGGKDSTFAIHLCLGEGHEITDFVTIKPERDDSYMFHSANINMVDLISQAAGIPLTAKTSSGEKEKELADLERALQKLDVEGVVAGAIESEYQASRVQRICDDLGLEMVAPMWHREPEGLLREMSRLMDIRMVHVSAMGLDEKWLGRPIDDDAISDLIELNRRYGIHICGEGGEYETLVLDAPFYKKRINIIEASPVWEGDRGIYLIKNAGLAEK